MPDYEAVIGLETHIQLNTETKIFCACKADSWGDPPNTNICPICTGQPGVLPGLNQAAVEKAVLLAAAMHAETIFELSYFARKNYFYPDLPKGYQISQYDEPLARGGYIDLPRESAEPVRVRISKLHIEEDAGKTVRENGRRLIDFNRCGVPLVEMVTMPDLGSADAAAEYIIRLRQLLRWLGISEADMEKGQLRCDANVSIRPAGATAMNPKTEIKNLNSIEAVRQATQTEIERQIKVVETGGVIAAWTLAWDEDEGRLRKMRTKETEADYRYFREPDLLPVHLDDAWRQAILAQLPELPLERRARFMKDYGLPAYDAEILTDERSLSDYFEAAAANGADPKSLSNWLMNDVLRMLRERGITAESLRLRPQDLAQIVAMVEKDVITTTTGRQLLEKVEDTGRRPAELVEAEGLAQVADEAAIMAVARQVVEANPEQVATYRGGKTSIIGWFVGQVMRETGGKANPQLAKQALEDLLEE